MTGPDSLPGYGMTSNAINPEPETRPLPKPIPCVSARAPDLSGLASPAPWDMNVPPGSHDNTAPRSPVRRARRARLTRAELESDFGEAGLFLRRACWDGVEVWLVGPAHLYDLKFQDCRLRGFSTLSEVESWWRLQAGCHRRHEMCLDQVRHFFSHASSDQIDDLRLWLWGHIISRWRPAPSDLPGSLLKEMHALLNTRADPMDPEPGYPVSKGCRGWRALAIAHWRARFSPAGRSVQNHTVDRIVKACGTEILRRINALPPATIVRSTRRL